MATQTSQCQLGGLYQRIFYLARRASLVARAGTSQNVLIFLNHTEITDDAARLAVF